VRGFTPFGPRRVGGSAKTGHGPQHDDGIAAAEYEIKLWRGVLACKIARGLEQKRKVERRHVLGVVIPGGFLLVERRGQQQHPALHSRLGVEDAIQHCGLALAGRLAMRVVVFDKHQRLAGARRDFPVKRRGAGENNEVGFWVVAPRLEALHERMGVFRGPCLPGPFAADLRFALELAGNFTGHQLLGRLLVVLIGLQVIAGGNDSEAAALAHIIGEGLPQFFFRRGQAQQVNRRMSGQRFLRDSDGSPRLSVRRLGCSSGRDNSSRSRRGSASRLRDGPPIEFVAPA